MAAASAVALALRRSGSLRSADRSVAPDLSAAEIRVDQPFFVDQEFFADQDFLAAGGARSGEKS